MAKKTEMDPNIIADITQALDAARGRLIQAAE